MTQDTATLIFFYFPLVQNHSHNKMVNFTIMLTFWIGYHKLRMMRNGILYHFNMTIFSTG